MRQVLFVAGLLAVFSVGARGQGPDGSDVNKAIPIYFDQVIDDILDGSTGLGELVYKITLARGQQFDMSLTAPSPKGYGLCLHAPGTITIKNTNCLAYSGTGGSGTFNALSLSYTVATAGTYYVSAYSADPSSKFQLRVTAKGTPLGVPNPTTAGCLNGRVDSILYSLQLIAAGLPDEVTIGGQRACASCTVKPPLYPEIASRLENALRSGVNVEACYDSAGSIFQLKLLRQ